MVEKFLPTGTNIPKPPTLEVSSAVNNITRQTAREIEENIRRENQGLPPEYVKNDPAGLTPERMEDGLQKMRQEGERKLVESYSRIENLPKNIVVIHTIRNGHEVGHQAQVRDTSWKAKFDTCLRQGTAAHLSCSFIEIGNFSKANLYGKLAGHEVGLILKSGNITDADPKDIQTRVIDGIRLREGETVQPSSFEAGRRMRSTISRYKKDDYNEVLIESPIYKFSFYAIDSTETERKLSLYYTNDKVPYCDFDEISSESDIEKVLFYDGKLYSPKISTKKMKIKKPPEGSGQKPAINMMNLIDGEIIYNPMEWNASSFTDPKFSLWEEQEVDVKFVSIGDEVRIK